MIGRLATEADWASPPRPITHFKMPKFGLTRESAAEHSKVFRPEPIGRPGVNGAPSPSRFHWRRDTQTAFTKFHGFIPSLGAWMRPSGGSTPSLAARRLALSIGSAQGRMRGFLN
jgi:hypothetical protein